LLQEFVQAGFCSGVGVSTSNKLRSATLSTWAD
jgi:hypothetical protein